MLDLFLLGLAALLVWVSLQAFTLQRRLRERTAEAQWLRQLLTAADQRNQDLLNSNYELALLNEHLFIAIDQHKPLATLLSWAAYRN